MSRCLTDLIDGTHPVGGPGSVTLVPIRGQPGRDFGREHWPFVTDVVLAGGKPPVPVRRPPAEEASGELRR